MGTTTYPAQASALWKGMPIAWAVLGVVALVALVLGPSWLGALVVAVTAGQAASWWLMRPGWVTVSAAGLRVKGVDGARLRPRDVEWSQIHGMNRSPWMPVVVLELDGGRGQPLPQLTADDTAALVAAVNARRQPAPPP